MGDRNRSDHRLEAVDWIYESWREDAGPMRRGSVYLQRAEPGLSEGVYRWEIKAFQPYERRVDSHASGEMEAELEISLEPLEGGRTRLTQTMRFRALPAFRPLGFLLERTVMKRKLQRDFYRMILPTLKRLIEERAAAR